MVLRRHVQVNGIPVFGTDERGWVLLQDVEELTRVYVSIVAIAEGEMPYEPLCDPLMEKCGIAVDKRANLLSILHTRSAAMIEDMLERADLMPRTVRPDTLPPQSDHVAPTSEDAGRQSPSTDNGATTNVTEPNGSPLVVET
ncbi:hypothetical protein LTR08_008176 [Meristemomyces frigidus]|nr:hypothetical protein LTR08_008176 [Meristemomyces frigidus]